MSEQKGLVINIYAGGSMPVTDVMIHPQKTAPKKSPPERPKKNKDKERGDALDVELLTRDSMADDEKMDLEQRVVLYIREMLKAKKVSVVREFLSQAKHHLDPTLKDSISEEITELKKGF